jgi:antitoxin VapB
MPCDLEWGMALSIKTEEADALARALAAETNETLTEAVTIALRERLERVRRERGDDYRARIARLQEEFRRYDVHDPRTDDEIVGYDQHGLPA